MSLALLDLLRERAFMLQRARAFFAERNILEIDCCALRPRAPIDANIDVIDAAVSDREKGFLHTSPEYAMKQFLSLGSGDIYYLGHVFRKGEIGRLHHPEFAMAEWYRTSLSFSEFLQEAAEFLFLFFGPLPLRTISYRDAFVAHAGVDPSHTSLSELQRMTHSNWSATSCLHYLLTHFVEPKLGRDELTFLIDYPPEEAALARVIDKNGEKVAERFEIYFEGVELANGYHELGDAKELRRRFSQENEVRRLQNKETYLLDEAFLSAMERSFPDCCGVSVGFDRALMLRCRAPSLASVLPFAWERDLH